MPVERSCGAVVFNDGGYLLLRYGRGHWGFVKGNVEPGEDERETVLREAEEETGLTPEQLSFVEGFRETTSYFYKKDGATIYKEVVFFLAESRSREVSLSHEHTDHAWLGYTEAMEQLTYDNAKNVLEKAERHRQKIL
ncbi:MAG: bis(5'-nucleosyl)-tetraphosphatase [Thermoplasmatota archaeon]